LKVYMAVNQQGGGKVKGSRVPEISWTTIVCGYPSCQMTKEKDKLVALSAIAKCQKELRRGALYLAGFCERICPKLYTGV
jgi:hypothetical protein